MLPEVLSNEPYTGVAVRAARPQQDPAWIRWALISAMLVVVGVLIVVPVVHVFAQALVNGVGVYWNNLFNDPDTLHSIVLTLTVAPAALVVNLIFGFDKNLKLPEVRQWNVSLEQGIGAHDWMSLGYVGSSGRFLTRRLDRSLALRRAHPRAFGNLDRWDHSLGLEDRSSRSKAAHGAQRHL